MARLRYDAVPNGTRWTIKFEGKAYGDFATQKAAARQAVDWAHEQGSKGHDAQVYVHRPDGTFRVEWTTGTTRTRPPARS